MSEETKKCRECQTDIPKKARRCPNCRAKQGIGAGGLLVAIIFIGIVSSMVISSLGEVDSKKAELATVSNFELGTYVVESSEFKHISTKQVNLWKSYSDRTLTGKVSEGDVVQITKHDDTNNYCYLTKGAQSGWASCDWLVKK